MEFDFHTNLADVRIEKPKFHSDEWEVGFGGSIAGPALYHEGALYIAACDGYIYAIDYKSKTLIWKFKANGIFVESRLSIFDDTI